MAGNGFYREKSEKQIKYEKWQANLAAAKERGREKYAQKQMALWSDDDKEFFRKLEIIRNFFQTRYYVNGGSKLLSNKEWSAISFAADMAVKVKEWGKAPSEKQRPYIEKAWDILQARPELLI